jgi:GcrA cell cycle regulator
MDEADRADGRAAPRRGRSDWNEARVALLARRWKEGASASVIAGELGGVSRSAVLGKVFRLKLEPPEVKLSRAPTGGRPCRSSTRNRPPSISLIALRAAARRLGLPPAATGDSRVDRESAGKAFGTPCGLLDLSAHTCRWPVGDPDDPDFAFCGAAPFAGHPYCVGHCLVAYRIDDGQGAPVANAARSNALRAINRAA